MRNEISWIATYSVRAGQLERLEALITEMVDATAREPAALGYSFSLSEDRSTVHLYEAYEDSKAAVDHMTKVFPRFAGDFFECLTAETFVVYGTPDRAAVDIFDGLGACYMSTLAGFSRRAAGVQ